MNGFGAYLGAKIDASSRLPTRAPLGSFSTNFGAPFGSILDPFVPFWRPFAPLDPFWHPLAPPGQAFGSNRPTLDALYMHLIFDLFAHFNAVA